MEGRHKAGKEPAVGRVYGRQPTWRRAVWGKGLPHQQGDTGLVFLPINLQQNKS